MLKQFNIISLGQMDFEKKPLAPHPYTDICQFFPPLDLSGHSLSRVCSGMIAWLSGCIVVWLHGCMVPWLHGFVTWFPGSMVVWLNGCKVAW
jgi:hypothetical protein